jgi:hypothetical protein
MKPWIVRTNRERGGTAGDSARRIRLWVARLFLRSARAISAEVIDDLIPSRDGDEFSTTDHRSPFEPTGPPPHWLARVREGAPELLLSPEQGGTPPNSFAALHPLDLNAETTRIPASRSNPDAPRAPESASVLPTPQPERFTSTPGHTPAPSHLLHDAEASPASKRSFDTGSYVRSPSVAPLKPVPSTDFPLPAPTTAPHASSSRREVHALPVKPIADEMQPESTHPPIVNRKLTTAAKRPPSHRSAESLASRQSTPANAKPVNLWHRVQQLWWGPRKISGDPVAPGSASAGRPVASLNQKSREARGNKATAWEHETGATPSKVPFDVDRWNHSVSLQPQRRMAPLGPINLHSFGSTDAAKAQTSAEASSVFFSEPDDDLYHWPELPEERSANGDEWFRALAESEHLRVLNREQRGGH